MYECNTNLVTFDFRLTCKSANSWPKLTCFFVFLLIPPLWCPSGTCCSSPLIWWGPSGLSPAPAPPPTPWRRGRTCAPSSGPARSSVSLEGPAAPPPDWPHGPTPWSHWTAADGKKNKQHKTQKVGLPQYQIRQMTCFHQRTLRLFNFISCCFWHCSVRVYAELGWKHFCRIMSEKLNCVRLFQRTPEMDYSVSALTLELTFQVKLDKIIANNLLLKT